jgi:hypothetical protein
MLFAEAPPAPIHPVMFLLKLVAPENMESKFATALTTQEPMSWLNAVAPPNMLFMFVTNDVSHCDPDFGMGWLNATAL